ncbi:MAG TPA: acetamidase/formamidase family protein [Pseudogracilibacillus sp.]|nr:acetamidase/formamidase family protein [Pseudogracilibacillus sp.]
MAIRNESKHYMTIHDFHDHSHVGWDNRLEPIAEVESGQVINFAIEDASGGQIKQGDPANVLNNLDFAKVNPTAGPIYVKGAEAGDTLEVEFLDFKQLDWGWTAIIPGFGLLSDEFNETTLKTYDLKNRQTTEFLHGIDIPLKPFPGTVGVALAEEGHFNVVPPRQNGGNMDVRHLTAGSKLYLPVWVEGALFSIGDTHAAQGDGEVCGTAIEAGMETTVRLTLHKRKAIKEPQFELFGPPTPEADSRGYFATTAHGEDMFEASQNAIRYMIEHLVQEYKLSEEEAYMLCSVAVDLRIHEVVNQPNMLVSAFLPKSIFK